MSRAKLSGDVYSVKVKDDRIILHEQRLNEKIKRCRIIDNQNGLTVKFYSNSPCYADKYFSFEYGQAEELYWALRGFYEQ